MVDYVKIKLKAGNGGHGAVSFFRTKLNPIGKPDGGDGGKGGDIYLMGSEDVTTLLDYNFKKHFEAPDGQPGGTNHRRGHSGEDLVLKVPVGTIVTLEKDLSYQDIVTVTAADNKLADITKHGEKVLIGAGGGGGRGNGHLKSYHPGREKSGTWEKVHHSEPGEPGEEKEVILELKLLADVGLIGFPNAGKSTLLSHLTKATPKIANYPFTTLEPNLGVMSFKGKSMVLADIPGLIEGASEGKGLGTQFLKHAERTRVLVHLISAETEDLKQAYEQVNKELSTYSKELTEKPQLVFISKTDLADKEELEERIKKLPKGLKILKVSSFSGEGLEELQKELLKYFN
jgi:GTP-binding protein